MADYHPLIARAVEGLSDRSPEMRRAVYERARSALLAQLRSLDPPLSEADIGRESASLETAIARVEDGYGSASLSASAPLPAPTSLSAPANLPEPAPGTAPADPGPALPREPAVEHDPAPVYAATADDARPRIDTRPPSNPIPRRSMPQRQMMRGRASTPARRPAARRGADAR
jgi:hypothetical protein